MENWDSKRKPSEMMMKTCQSSIHQNKAPYQGEEKGARWKNPKSLQTKNPPKKKYKMRKPQVLANEESSKECGLLGEGGWNKSSTQRLVTYLGYLPFISMGGWEGDF